MNFEKMTPQQDEELRKQTIEAVREGSALPTYEGMNDSEIAKAFQERLESMSPDDFETFSNDFETLSTDLINEIKDGTEDSSTWKHSISFNTLYKYFFAFTSLSMIGMAGSIAASPRSSAAAMAVLSGAYALGSAIISLSSAKKESLGEAKLASVQRHTDSLIEAIEEARKNEENDFSQNPEEHQ